MQAAAVVSLRLRRQLLSCSPGVTSVTVQVLEGGLQDTLEMSLAAEKLGARVDRAARAWQPATLPLWRY